MGKEEGDKKSYPKRYLFTAAQASYYLAKEKDSEGNIKLVPRKWGGKGQEAKLNQTLYDGFRRFADEHEAELRIFPMQGLSVREDKFHSSVEKLPELMEWKRHFTALNSNVTETDIRVPPQNVDPTTSRKPLTAKYRSTLIYPHSKQRMCPVPSSPSEFPRFLVTTGCITIPNYNIDMNSGIGSDRADQAVRDHKMGGVYVEVLDNERFLFRIINANLDGKFIDLGKQYEGSSKKKKKVGVEALVLGDIHFGEHDEDTMSTNYEMISEFRPSRLVLHDLFTGLSISHHNLKKPLYRAKQYAAGELSLEEELRTLHAEVKEMSRRTRPGRIYVVHSNHDDFLEKYLEDGSWRDVDLWNAEVCSSLYSRILRNNTPGDMYLKEALSMFGKIPSNVVFLGLNDKLSVQGHRLSTHGHKGANGSRGMSIKAVDEILGKAVIGHKHAPEIYRDSYVVGTSSRLNLNYTAGSANAAMGANLAIYSNGRAQMLPIISGRWK